MVAPFTPYEKHIRLLWPNGQPTLTLDAYGSKQKPPYVNTSYSALITGCNTPNYSWGNNVYSDAVRDTAMVIATNKAYAKLVSELGDTSSFGATLLAERKQTYGMLRGAVLNAYLAARAVRRGDLVKAASHLGVSPPVTRVKKIRRTRKGKGRKFTTYVEMLQLPTGRMVAKSSANKWLWYSYGVKPLMTDCYNAVDVLKRDIPFTRVEGSGSGRARKQYDDAGWPITMDLNIHEAKAKVKMSVNVRLKNPNLWLANQMGLVNPVQIINEGIMFSFVIDWFSNLSQIIMSMTDFVGLETSDPVTSSFSRQTWKKVGKNPSYGLSWSIDTFRRDFSRELTLVMPKLRFAYERFEWQRGANAISLLVQFLKNK